MDSARLQRIVVVRADAQNRGLAEVLDGSFEVDARLRLRADAQGIRYDVESVRAYTKNYADSAASPRISDAYIGSDDTAAYLALVQDRAAGVLLISHDWNGLALIEQIEIDRNYRRRGIGTLLVDQAVRWAQARGLPGLRLETQDTNVAACQLYARNGFVLGGFDRHLYAAIPAHAKETALYWYRLFNVAQGAP